MQKPKFLHEISIKLKFLSNSDAITVVPYWELINIYGKKKIIEPKIFNNKNLFKRILNCKHLIIMQILNYYLCDSFNF